MSQRNSGHARVPADLYQTPGWVLDALAEHVSLTGRVVWEPACGGGQMVRALEAHGAQVFATDLLDQGFGDMAATFDFTSEAQGVTYFGGEKVLDWFDDVITNPPYGAQGRTAEKFIERGLERLPTGGVMALLLQADFDSAGGRPRLFRDCPDFAGRVVLNRRIEWFPRRVKPNGSKEGGPSANHTWFIWQRRVLRQAAPAFTVYAPAKKLLLEDIR